MGNQLALLEELGLVAVVDRNALLIRPDVTERGPSYLQQMNKDVLVVNKMFMTTPVVEVDLVLQEKLLRFIRCM